MNVEAIPASAHNVGAQKYSSEQMSAKVKAHVAMAEAWMALPHDEKYRPSPEFWRLALPTFMESWPLDLHRLSIPSVRFRLSLDEARMLGSYVAEMGEEFDPPRHRAMLREVLIGQMDKAVQRFGRVFVRLGFRSPKDARYWGINESHMENGRLESGAAAFALLTACSERVVIDLHQQIAMGYEPSIWLREGLDIPEWSEFRCFVKDRKLVGISQYYYSKPYPEILEDMPGIRWAIHQFFNLQFRDACHLNSVVFDVFLKRRKVRPVASNDGRPRGEMRSYEVTLLEINPYYPLSDPCLFDWESMDDFRGQLRARKEPGGRTHGIVDVHGG